MEMGMLIGKTRKSLTRKPTSSTYRLKMGKGIKSSVRIVIKSKSTKTAKSGSQKKPPSISKLITLCDKEFSIQVRMKGAWLVDGVWWNRCYTSGYEAPVKKLHCGHYLSRYYKAARWDFDNARPQSMMANMWMRGDPINFRRNLINEIGEARVLAVEALRDAPIKLTREFLEATLTELKALSTQ